MKILILLLICQILAAGPHTTVEHAKSPEELKWGLMGRTEIPPDHGMLLHYPHSGRHGVWMFNCFCDLSVAFLDEGGKVMEIHRLKAHPELMARTDPINSVEDLEKITFEDPAVQFFISKSVRSAHDAKYALEMPWGWFEKNGVSEGDIFLWDESNLYLSKSPE